MKKVPIYVNSFNRLTMLRNMVSQLLSFEMVEKIVIVDNASTYEPLRAWLHGEERRSWGVELIEMPDNVGPRAAFYEGTAGKKPTDYFAVTDGDLCFAECPKDLIPLCIEALVKYPKIVKAGCSLRIDDLPPEYPFADFVRRMEAGHWTIETGNQRFYRAPIDTTFAIYRGVTVFDYQPAIRTKPPHCARHLPWYHIPGQLSEEDRAYLDLLPVKHKSGIFWTTLMHDNQQKFL